MAATTSAQTGRVAHVHPGVLGRAVRRPRPRLVGPAQPTPGRARRRRCTPGHGGRRRVRRGRRRRLAGRAGLAGHRRRRLGGGARAGQASTRARPAWPTARRGCQADLVAGDPLPGGADLVSAQYLHVPDDAFAPVYAAIAGRSDPAGRCSWSATTPPTGDTGLRNPRLSPPAVPARAVTELLDAELADRRRRRPHPRGRGADGRAGRGDRHGRAGHRRDRCTSLPRSVRTRARVDASLSRPRAGLALAGAPRPPRPRSATRSTRRHAAGPPTDASPDRKRGPAAAAPRRPLAGRPARAGS